MKKKAKATIEITCEELINDGHCDLMVDCESICGGKCCLFCDFKTMKKCNEICDDLKMTLAITPFLKVLNWIPEDAPQKASKKSWKGFYV